MLLTFLLLVGGFHVHGVEREARFSGNGEVGDSQRVHLFLSLTPGAALWRQRQAGKGLRPHSGYTGQHIFNIVTASRLQLYLLELLQTFRNVERDVDERPVGLVLKNRTGSNIRNKLERVKAANSWSLTSP